jgi:hypothetical protein
MVGWVFAWASVLTLPASAVRLEWAANPVEERVAFYTLYAESPAGTLQTNIYGATSIDLGFLLSNITFTLYLTATSDAGLESDRSAPLVFPILSAPVITQQPIGKIVASATRLTLSARVLSNLPATYQWWKDGAPLSGQTAPDLVIERALLSNSGTYQLVVENLLGRVESSPAVVIVQNPPRILTEPASVDVTVGLRALLVAGVDGTDLQYQWFKNGEPLPGATNRTLNIQSISFSDAGSYRLRISNLLGALESGDAIVRVWPAITILQQPVSTRVRVDDSFRLFVEANGPQPLTYQWYRDNTRLDGQTSSELFITNATTADSGNYWVRITGVAGSVTSALAQVIVEELAEGSFAVSMTKSAPGQLSISARGPANTSFDLLVTSDLQNPNWTLLRTITTDASGRVNTSFSMGTAGNAFIRAARR